jgi:hypothetical protein
MRFSVNDKSMMSMSRSAASERRSSPMAAK